MSERKSVAGTEPSEATSSDPAEPPIEPAGSSEAALEPDVEVVDGFPVLAEVRTVERVSPASLPAVQAAAAAGAGFVAGAATVALIRRRSARKVARNSRGGSRGAAGLLPIAATRSFLVDVHVIARPE